MMASSDSHGPILEHIYEAFLSFCSLGALFLICLSTKRVAWIKLKEGTLAISSFFVDLWEL